MNVPSDMQYQGRTTLARTMMDEFFVALVSRFGRGLERRSNLLRSRLEAVTRSRIMYTSVFVRPQIHLRKRLNETLDPPLRWSSRISATRRCRRTAKKAGGKLATLFFGAQ